MTYDAIEKARIEALRFIQRVDVLQLRLSNPKWGNAQFPKETGAVRRQSMELTRALADLRRS